MLTFEKIKTKSIKKAFRILFFTVLAVLLLFLIVGVAFQFETVQTYAAQKATTYYSQELNTKIKIQKIRVDFFNTLELQDFYVEDLNRDTLAYLKQLDIELYSYNWEQREIVANLSLVKPILKFNRDTSVQEFNYQFFFDHFSGNGGINNNFKMDVVGLIISDGEFHFHDDQYSDDDSQFNYHHIDVAQLEVIIKDLSFKKEHLEAKIRKLALIENGGFILENFEADLKIDSSSFDFKNLVIQTPFTDIDADILFSADSMKHYTAFNQKVEIFSKFKNSLVSIEDIAFFAPPLKGIRDQVYLNGKITGTIDNLSGEDIEIQINKETMLMGDFDLRGLPEIEKTFLIVDVEEFRTTAEGLKKIPYPPFNEPNHIPLPVNVDSLGVITFNGNYTGYYNDFVAYGTFSSALGNLKTDISLKEENGSFKYKGSLGSSGFNVGSFFNVRGMSKLNFDLEVDGNGLSREHINVKAKGKINGLEYKGYNYQNIQLNGQFIKETYQGEIIAKDENLDLNFNGKINADEKKPISQFAIRVNRANLGKLNLFNKRDSVTQIRFNAILNIEGKDIDDIEGEAIVDSLYYIDSKQKQKIETFKLVASKLFEQRSLHFESSILDADLEGNFKLKQFVAAYRNMLVKYIPNSSMKSNEVNEQEFDFSVVLKRTKPITEVFLPTLKIDSATIIEGNFSSKSNKSSIKIKGPQLQYGSNVLRNYNIEAYSEQDTFYIHSDAVFVKPFGLKSFDDFKLDTYLSDGINESEVSWKAIDSRAGKGQIKILNKIEALTKMKLNLYSSYITINDSIWEIGKNNSISIDSTAILVQNLSIKNGDQELAIDGVIAEDSSEIINVNLTQISLNYLSSLLPEDIINLKGIANGEAKGRDVYKNLSLTSDLSFDSLTVNSIDIGDAFVRSKWNPQTKSLNIQANLGDIQDNLLRLEGDIFPLQKKNSLDLVLQMKQFPIALMQPYIKNYLTDLSGTVNGKVKVKGVASQPILKGKLLLDKAKMKVNYLNTTYEINDEVIIEPDFIGFNLIDIFDSRGKKAVATGSIFHENYSDFNLDVGLEFDEFLALNTTSLDNELYYGTAITSGVANISGFADQLIFEIDLTAERGTDFKIPLDESVDVSNSEFLIFTNSPDYKLEKEIEVDLSGIQLNFDLEILPDADVQIIFDEQIGDIIKAQGLGNLKLEINTLGNFNMYGQYVVEKGDYLFTLQNIVNKRFDLLKGSRIYWDGDPYQARLDMKAIYNLRAPLYDLFPDDSSGGFTSADTRRRIPVELELQMTDYLLSPTISFDIRLPTANDRTKRALESILYVNNNDVNRQEMNQQVFGLLVLNRFLPSASAANTGDGYDRGTPGLNNGYEFLSNQLSNWASRISDNFDVGLNYRPANELNSDEFDLSISTETLGDRLILDGNFGYIGNSGQFVDENNQTSNFIGEFSAEYKLSKDGRFRVRGFNRSTQNNLLQLNSPYTQGVGVFYREEFDNLGELWRKYFDKKD